MNFRTALFLLAIVAWAVYRMFGETPVAYYSHLNGECIAVEYEGEFHSCRDFANQTMNKVWADPDMTLEKLRSK